MLSIIAVAMSGIAFVATRNPEPTERQVHTVARHTETPAAPQHHAPKQTVHKKKPVKPQVDRGATYVEVYNNSGITGLAGRYAGQATTAGWKVVGSDNWYGTIAASTVYYPERLKAAAKLLALDLGIHRTMVATGPMRRDRLTVILTADAN
jgi:hypothetical protein